MEVRLIKEKNAAHFENEPIVSETRRRDTCTHELMLVYILLSMS